MRWAIVIFAILAVLSLIGRQLHYVPGQEEQPALAKAALCRMAAGVHKALIERSLETGLVIETRTETERVYILVVDDVRWTAEPIESKELLAIAAWCQVAGEDGRAVASVIGGQTQNEVASVVEGEFTVPEKAF